MLGPVNYLFLLVKNYKTPTSSENLTLFKHDLSCLQGQLRRTHVLQTL